MTKFVVLLETKPKYPRKQNGLHPKCSFPSLLSSQSLPTHIHSSSKSTPFSSKKGRHESTSYLFCLCTCGGQTTSYLPSDSQGSHSDARLGSKHLCSNSFLIYALKCEIMLLQILFHSHKIVLCILKK